MGSGSISHRVNIAPKQLERGSSKVQVLVFGFIISSLKCNVGTLHVLDAECSCNLHASLVVGTGVPGANRIAQNGYGDGTSGPTEHLTAMDLDCCRLFQAVWFWTVSAPPRHALTTFHCTGRTQLSTLFPDSESVNGQHFNGWTLPPHKPPHAPVRE